MCVCELSEINFERSSHTWTVQSSLNVICCVLERCQFTLATPQSARENEHCMIITVAFPSHPVLTYTLTLIFVHLFYCLFLILISCLCHCSLNSYSVHTSVYCALSTKQVIIYFITAINTSPGSVFISHEVNMTKMQLVLLPQNIKFQHCVCYKADTGDCFSSQKTPNEQVKSCLKFFCYPFILSIFHTSPGIKLKKTLLRTSVFI